MSVIGAARQDSGGISDFKELMDQFGYSGVLMASEIEKPDDLVCAQKSGYLLFGAGGFMGDSEAAHDSSKTNISMAVKVLRVHAGGLDMFPVKTGETDSDGKIKADKFEVDGLLPPQELQKAKERAQVLANAIPLLDAASLQRLFEDTLYRMLNLKASYSSRCKLRDG